MEAMDNCAAVNTVLRHLHCKGMCKRVCSKEPFWYLMVLIRQSTPSSTLHADAQYGCGHILGLEGFLGLLMAKKGQNDLTMGLFHTFMHAKWSKIIFGRTRFCLFFSSTWPISKVFQDFQRAKTGRQRLKFGPGGV